MAQTPTVPHLLHFNSGTTTFYPSGTVFSLVYLGKGDKYRGLTLLRHYIEVLKNRPVLKGSAFEPLKNGICRDI